MTKVEFVSYDGAYPCLCMGTLVLKINGVEAKFHFSFNNDKDKGEYSDFWSSGGGVTFDEDWNENVSIGAWRFFPTSSSFPEELKEIGDLLIAVFNENVPYGCCGGCV